MSQAEALASHWVLLFFLGLLNKYMLAWSLDYASVERSSARQNYIHRTWSEWSIWSACSRTCGGGVKMRTRVCKISRLFGVSFETNACIGETVEYELCSIHNCSPYDKEFLEYQCSLRDGQNIGGRKIEEWIPYQYGKHPCELQCWSKDRTLIHTFGKVIDGTKCATSDPKQPALCINGRCTPVDCAGQIGYDNKLDKCGVCRGDNSTCVHYKDVFWRRPRTRTAYDDHKDHHYDYEKIAVIPAGATEILIKESSETNFLALMDHKGNYQVNGNWRIQSPGRFFFHGAEFLYNRTWDGEESLSSLGPIRFDISIYVLGSGDIPTVHYEYWISSNNPFKSAQPFQILNQIKNTHIYENKAGGSKYSQPENNHIHDSSSKKQVIPVTRFQGYKSYYHRNEILKSVPSWSIKRHRTHKNNLNKYIHTQSDISTSVRRDNVDGNPRFVQLESQKRVPTLATENDIAVTVGLLDKDDNLFNSRAYNNRENIRPHNRSHVAPIHRTSNFDRSTEIAPFNNRNRYDLKQRNVISTVAPLRKKKSENFGRNTEEYGRTTTTLVQPRSFNYQHATPVTSQPKLSEQENDAKSKNGNRKRKSSDNQKHEKKRRKSENGECLPCSKPKHQKKIFCTSDFVLRAVVLSSERQEDSYRYELQISQSYKNKVPISPREYIWSIDTCRCPKLRAGKEYIIMGHSGTSGNKRESRLLISRNSFVRKYTQKRARTMLRLVRDQNSICRQFE